ncbi:MAG: LTA synthase family protein [Gammaproteobacteria bacterium]|nr:LTA synthase family protein [Gammaproteobacteria bacterium]
MDPEHTQPPASSKAGLDPLLADVIFLLGYALAYLGVMALLRGLLLYTNLGLAEQIPLADLTRTFLVGLRFDLIITCYLGAPLVLVLLLPGGLGTRRLALLWLGITGALTLFAGVTELEFYREFHTRLNSIAFHYLQEDVTTVSSMIWNGYPVLRYLLLWLLLSGIYITILRRLDRLTPKRPVAGYRVAMRGSVFFLIMLLAVWGGRGTLRSGPPLRWGDAFHSQHLFANHLALNGTYTLFKAAMAAKDSAKDEDWLTAMPADTALAITRDMLLTPRDTLLEPDEYPLLRLHTPDVRLPQAPKNIVLIIMESFSSAFTGAMGPDYGITPEFDKLAAQGLLFERFFSNGTHTHQGMFAIGACFPNLPGYEYLMQQPEGQHRFSGLPTLLKPMGFNDVYVYNGHFAWDNQEGFFRNQGMSRFIGRDDYVNPVFKDATWGVSDEDMFNRSVEELNRLDPEQPFFAVLQTLSNHTPYALPEVLPVEAVSGFGNLDEHLTAQRYSDWALGQFFAKVVTAPWFNETLFVIVGDHGFGLGRQLSDIGLLRFHVPLLLLGPGIQESYGSRRQTVATQVDVVPTIVSLLGKPFVHQCWGRDLLALPENDAGLGIIKPSGSDPTVALLRGDRIVIKPPGGKARSGSYSLYPDEAYRPDETAHNDEQTAAELSAYIQVAMQALYANRTGLPDIPVGSKTRADSR